MAPSPRTKKRETPRVGRPAGTPDADSRVSKICDLGVGQSESLSVRMTWQEATRDEVIAVKQRLSNNLRAAARRAADRTGGTYEGDTGDFRCTGGDTVVITAVITRVS